MTESSITLLAQVLGPVAVLGSLGLLANQARLKKLIEQVANNDAMQFMVHVLRMMSGLFIMAVVPDTTELLNLAFTIGGALATVIGAAGLLFPDVDAQVLKRTVKHINRVNACLLINLLVGLALVLLGYVA